MMIQLSHLQNKEVEKRVVNEKAKGNFHRYNDVAFQRHVERVGKRKRYLLQTRDNFNGREEKRSFLSKY